MSAQPTDPAAAVAAIRRAAAAMRDVANGVGTVGHDWTVNPPDGHYSWTIGSCDNAVQVAETPDYGGLELPDHIALWTPPIALLVADVLDGLAVDIDRHCVRWGHWSPAEWTAAYNLAAAFLERRSS